MYAPAPGDLDSVPGVVALLALRHHVNVLAEEVH